MIFKSKSEDPVEKLLKQSGEALDFNLDQENGKLRLIQTIQNQSQLTKTRHINPFILRSSLALATIVLFVGGTFAAASKSIPGDMLFSVNKFKEKILLSLPLSPANHAEIQASIVEDRLKALDILPLAETPPVLKIQERQLETLKEARTSLNQAMDNIQKTRDFLIEEGKMEQAEKLDEVLFNISEISERREEKILEFEHQMETHTREELEPDEKQERIREQLSELQKAREKARLQNRNED